jgi:hypothetical protein
MLHQEGQVFELKSCGRNATRLWAYRYRVGGRGSRRVQRGGFASAEDALALERAVDAGWTSARRPATPHSETVSRPHRRRLAAAVDARWTAQLRSRRTSVNRRARLAATSLSPLTDSNVDPLLTMNASGNRSQPTATAFGCLSRFRRIHICHRLPPVATAGLHKGSILCCRV